MRRPARSQARSRARPREPRISFADPHDVAASAILDREVLVGNAAGQRQRVHAPEPDRKRGDARRRTLSRLIKAHALEPSPGQRGRLSASELRPQIGNLRGKRPAQVFRLLGPSGDLADGLLRRQDLGLALLDHLAHRRPLEAFVLEQQPR